MKEHFIAPKTIGIIGGGQLALMLGLAARRFCYDVIVLDPLENCPAKMIATEHIHAAYTELNALKRLKQKCDVITYEFENIALESLNFLEEDCYVYPSSKALYYAQDRVFEKEFIQSLGLKTADWFFIKDKENIKDGVKSLKGKAIFKTRNLGYDGKGQVLLEEGSENFLENLQKAKTLFEEYGGLLEGIVEFQKEISVICARNQIGECIFYDIGENFHENGILKRSIIPASISESVKQTAYGMARKMLEALSYVGILSVEFFCLKDDTLRINEFAPRVHNSGHWTEAGCLTSQFEQHIRAICGQKFGSTQRHSDCLMKNILGQDMSFLEEYYNDPQCFLHLYGKKEIKKQRKMGHAIFLLPKT